MGTFYSKGNLNLKHTGTIGRLGCLSFNGNKIITSGGGGMIVTNDQKLADKAFYLSNQAKDDPIKFIHNEVGYNYRLTNIQAAIGLAQLDIREAQSDQVLTLNSGFDYCSLGGDIIQGYIEGNDINFAAGTYDSNEEYQLIPTSTLENNPNMTFNNETYVITELISSEPVHSVSHVLSDDRDWDRFNVYSRVTNHQGTTTRECNNNGVCDEGESFVDCFDDCCPLAGTGENTDWCLVETVDGISNFLDNLSTNNYQPLNNTTSSTINYRVWLLNDEDEEVVKTIDTEIEYEADFLFCEGIGDVNGDGTVNVVDIVSLVQHVIGTLLITDPVLLCEADLNEDNLYNIVDIVSLVNLIIGEQ